MEAGEYISGRDKRKSGLRGNWGRTRLTGGFAVSGLRLLTLG